MNFQKPSLTIATPAKSQIHSKFALSLLSATSQLSKHFNVMIDILPGKSNIIHARSIMLSKWYDNSRDEDLFLFIDSDHVFTANDIIKLTNEPNCDVTCGIYVSAAGSPNCYPVDRENFDKDNRAYYCATGFMLIRKDICKRMHQWMKANDKIDRVNIDASNENAVPFFRTRFANNPYPEVKQDCPDWLGEDYSFCWLVRQAGGTIRATISADSSDNLTFGTGSSGTEGMRIDTNGHVTKPLQSAFSVTDSGPQSDYATQSTVTIGFDTEVFDVNGDFASSTFTAPVTGKYVLCGNITFSNMDQDADFTSVTIDTSNRNYSNIIDPEGFDKDLSYFSFTITVVADMDASDTAKVTFYQSAGAAVADLATGQTYFSGYLLG